MTKEELMALKISEGYNITPLISWRLVSELNNFRKYDVTFEKNNIVATAQVAVRDEGLPTETAEVIGTRMGDTPETFNDRFTTFIRSMEIGNIFAISRVELNESDMIATANVYEIVNNDVSKSLYVVRERSGIMEFKKVV